MNVRRVVVGFAALLVVAAGCTNYKKSGDAAAKAGNWKAAEQSYAIALAKKPDDPELKKKHAEAKQKAFDGSLAMAKGCIDQKNWPCAVAEGDYAAKLDPAHGEAKSVSAAAHKGYAMDDLAKARTGVTGDAAWGLDMVDHAKGLSTDPEVMRDAQAITVELVNAVLQQAGDLRKQAAAAGGAALPLYDKSIQLLERGARADTRCNQMLAEVKGERARWIDAEYEKMARAGDDALVKLQWPVALQQYNAAEALRPVPPGRAKTAAVYAKTMMDAEAAVQRRDWAVAAGAYRSAAGMGEDSLTRRAAASQIDRVEVRAYRFRLSSLLVNPVGPDGKSWTGYAETVRLAQPPQSNASGPRGPAYRDQLKGYSSRLPPAAKPNLVVDVTLPDGRELRTAPKNDAWATFDAWFVLDSNQLDTRPVLLHVMHLEKNGNLKDIATVNIPLGVLVSGAGAPPSGPILWVDTMVDFPRTIADGAFGGWASVVPGRANEATDASSPSSAAAIGWRLARVDAAVRGTDVKGGSPDLRVVIEQSGREVYKSPEIKGSADGSWAPENVYVFAAPQEQIIVKLLDSDPAGGNAVVYGGGLAAPSDRLATVEAKTPQGSLVRLVFEKRDSRP